MSDEKIGEHNADTGYEHEDLSPQGVFYFMGGVAVLGVVIYFILIGMYRFLDNYDRTHQPAVNPMAASTGVDPQTMNYKQILEQAQQTFPKPVLEHSEQTQYMEELKKENEVLGSYDWVDQKNGVVRIPIDRAMDLLAQRGLPVVSQADSERAASGDNTADNANAKAAAPQKAKATKGQQ
jgi:hypothetical protein